ncbi:NUDIX domain-containing protein [Kineococcus sp. NUM-3379]
MTGEDGLHSVSVAAAIVDDQGRVLVIQRADNGHWEPPGGVLMPHEGVEQGLRREVLEETGIEIEPLQLTGVYKNQARGILALVFRARPVTGVFRSNEEAKSAHWLTREEIAGLVQEVYAIRLLDAIDTTGIPRIRDHDGVRVVRAAS